MDTEKLLTQIKKYIKQFDEDEQSTAAEQIIMEAVIWGGKDHYQMLGILEECKLSLREEFFKVLESEQTKLK